MMKRFLSILLAVMMVASLGSFAALAADEGATLYADLTKVGISKTLNVADGITGYPATYSFKFTAVATDTVAEADHPAIANKDITVGEQSNDEATGTITFEFLSSLEFPHAGEYKYTIEEVAPDAPESTDEITKTLTADTSKYTLRVYVVNDGTSLKIAGITVETVVEGGEGEKVDPTIVQNENEHDISGVNFTNTYTEVINSTKDGVLTVTKTITGDYADRTKEFPITVKLTLPSTATAADVAVATGTTLDGTTATANLADGGKIQFTKLPAGTTFTVSETQDDAYKSKITGFVKTEDTALVEGNRTDVEGKAPITAAKNNVAIENNREDLVPTGVIINNLPYVLLVVIAGGALAFMALKKKAYKA